MDMLELDGSEGGGQLLRSALTLALCTGMGFTMRGIRGKRSRPGLMRQHLTGVQAAVAISGGEAVGATLGSTELTFVPGTVRAGDYAFPVGTAGSTMLVLQTLLPALWRADAPSRVRLEGGTHNPMAPSADFIEHAYLAALARMGVQATLALESYGFHPAGGGAVVATVAPCEQLGVVSFASRGALVGLEATAIVSGIAAGVGRRELDVVRKRFDLDDTRLHLRSVRPAIGPGNALGIRVAHADHVEYFMGYGERRVSAESVAERLSGQVRRYLDSGACVAEHLADQLLVPMALAGGGDFTTCTASDHLRSNAALIEKFVAVDIDITPAESAGGWEVRVVA